MEKSHKECQINCQGEEKNLSKQYGKLKPKKWRRDTGQSAVNCCKIHVNAVSKTASVSVYLSASISATESLYVDADAFSAVFVTSFAHLDTFRFISSTKCAQYSTVFGQQEGEEEGRVVVEL